MITARELFELYEDTLHKSGTRVLEEDDITLGTYIFEDFVVGAHSFLCLNSLNRLHENDLISRKKLELSLQLHEWASEISARDEWSVEKVRTSVFWRDLMALSDRILAMG